MVCIYKNENKIVVENKILSIKSVTKNGHFKYKTENLLHNLKQITNCQQCN